MKKILLMLVTLVLAVCAQSSNPSTGASPRSEPVKAPAPQPFASEEAMHAEFVRRFMATPGFGYSRVMVPEFYRPTPHLELDGKPFLVRAPDLIGLEEADAPVAYSPNQRLITKSDFTNRTARALLKKRPLTAFETNAVTALRAGRDLVITAGTLRKAGEPVLALGALRATGDCMKCHGCAEGTLLGAFSYTLVPAPAELPVAPAITNQVSPAILSRR